MRISDWSSDVCSSDLIYIKKSGRFRSDGDIHYDYTGKRKINPAKENKDYPVYSITRISEKLLKDLRSFSSGDFGEQCALWYYKDYPHYKAFTYKANASEKGIDIWAYSTKKKLFLIHESKNRKDSVYKLDTNQMTKKWCLSYLLIAFQDIIKEQAYFNDYGDEGRQFSKETLNHLQQAFAIIVKDHYKSILTKPLKEKYANKDKDRKSTQL